MFSKPLIVNHSNQLVTTCSNLLKRPAAIQKLLQSSYLGNLSTGHNVSANKQPSFQFLRRVQLKHPLHHTFFELHVDYVPNLAMEKTEAVVSLVNKDMEPIEHIGSYLQAGGYNNMKYSNYRKQVWEMAKQLENSYTQLFENAWHKELQCESTYFMESLGYFGSNRDECEQCLQEHLLQCLYQLDKAGIKSATIPLWYPTNYVTKVEGESLWLEQERVTELMLEALVEQFFLRDFAFPDTAPLHKNLQLIRLVQMKQEDSDAVCRAFDKRQFAKELYCFLIAKNHKEYVSASKDWNAWDKDKQSSLYEGFSSSNLDNIFIPDFKDL